VFWFIAWLQGHAITWLLAGTHRRVDLAPGMAILVPRELSDQQIFAAVLERFRKTYRSKT